MLQKAKCSACGHELEYYKNPVPTVDIIIELPGQGIVLVHRKNFPPGWAIPGGFVDYGESVEAAARREAFEETGLHVELRGLLGVYSAPERDPRGHTITTVFVATSHGTPMAGDDAARVAVYPIDRLPADMAFDHGSILQDYLRSALRKL